MADLAANTDVPTKPPGALPRPEMPRLFASEEKAVEALDYLRAHPEEILDHLLLAGGLCQGRKMYGAAAAVLIAADQLMRRGIL